MEDWQRYGDSPERDEDFGTPYYLREPRKKRSEKHLSFGELVHELAELGREDKEESSPAKAND